MAYNNYYGGYYPQYQNGAVPDMLNQYKNQYQPLQMAQPIQQIPTPTNEMIWVLNENEATSYPVAPNNSVVLWDKNEPIIYVKSVNASGMPSMRVLEFIERNTDSQNMPKNAPRTHKCACEGKYPTLAQFEALQGDLERLTAKVDELSAQNIEKPKTTSKKAKESEE